MLLAIKNISLAAFILSSVCAIPLAAKNADIVVPTGLVYQLYSPQTAKYIPTPVVVTQKDKYLQLKYKGTNGNDLSIDMYKKFVPSFINATKKYLTWEEIATQRGDTIIKEIDFFSYLAGTKILAQFESISPSEHYVTFVLRSSMLGPGTTIPNVSELKLNKENALKFIDILNAYNEDKLVNRESDEIYN